MPTVGTRFARRPATAKLSETVSRRNGRSVRAYVELSAQVDKNPDEVSKWKGQTGASFASQ